MDDPHILFCVKNGCEMGEPETAEGRRFAVRIRLNKIKFLFKRGERGTHGAFTAVAFSPEVPYTEGRRRRRATRQAEKTRRCARMQLRGGALKKTKR